MIAAIGKEIQLVANATGEKHRVSTLYFGGGTPSLLTTAELSYLIDLISENYLLDKDAEITIEANPDDIHQLSLQQWRSVGINRLSIGVQSFYEADLVWMNRAHNSTQALHSIHAARAAGFDNFSIDLIYGSPFLTNDEWKKNVETVISLNVPHISSYALTVEPGTALDKMIINNKSSPVEQEKQAEQFLQLMQWLGDAGYEHYEISNFALPGKRSRHNSSYWKGIAYTGFGPSAHSFNGKSRRWNISNNNTYIKQIGQGILPFEEEMLSSIQRLNEYVMISLRTMEGIDLQKIQIDFGEKYSAEVLAASQKYLQNGRIILHDQTIRLTSEGKLFADGIAADLFTAE